MKMPEYKYRLAPYAGKTSRLNCPQCKRPRCFSPYVDEAGEPLHPSVGRCNHECSCGYHYTPAAYFKDHPDSRQQTDWRSRKIPDRPQPPRRLPAAKPTSLCFIPADIVTRSIRYTYDSHLVTFLRTLFDEATIHRLISDYSLGVTRDRATIFFQLDCQNRCRGGKIIRYNSDTGHRIKDNSRQIPVDWIHPRLKAKGILPQNWTMTQCLFGEHLLPLRTDATVVLVEAEKTAVIGSGFVPEYIWLATGGRSGLNQRIDILEGRRTLIFPDVDAHDYWKQRLSEHPNLQYYLSDTLRKAANMLGPSADIADWLVSPPKSHPPTPIHPIRPASDTFRTASRYVSPEALPALQALITDLDLTLNTITRIQTP